MQELKARVGVLQNSQVSSIVEDLNTKINTLESKAESFTEGLGFQNSFQTLVERSFNNLTNLQHIFQDKLDGLSNRTTVSLNNTAGKIAGTLQTILSSLSEQQTISANQANTTQSLQQQLEELQNTFEEQQDLHTQLQSNLTTSVSTLEEQRSLIANIQEQLLEQQNLTAELVTSSSERSQAIAHLQSTLAATLKRMESEEQSLAELKSSLNSSRQGLDTQEVVSTPHGGINADLHNLEAVQTALDRQKNATDKLRIQFNQTSATQNQTVLGLQQQITSLQQTHDNFSIETTSNLKELAQTLKNIQENQTETVMSVNVQLQTLDEYLEMSNQNYSALTQNFQTDLDALHSSLEEVKHSVNTNSTPSSSLLSMLEQDVPDLHTQYQSLLLRLDSAWRETEKTIEEKLLPVRLVGGSNSREGRVEIRVGDRWGTICDDQWDENDARVICAMLGYFQPGAMVRQAATFGQGTGPIVLDEVECTGSEKDISTCPSAPFGTHNCGHHEDAGVICPDVIH